MAIHCPRCPVTIEVSEEDPDCSLSELWEHLGNHEWDPNPRHRLFVIAQARCTNPAGEPER